VLSTAAALPSFLLAAVLYGLAFAAVQPALMALVVDRAAPNRRGAAMGTFSTAMDLGIGSGSMIWGVVAQTAGFTAMYTASATVAVLALAVFLAGTLRRRGQAVDHQAPAGNP
jgi:predicted MFS family arabinose efflux permease